MWMSDAEQAGLKLGGSQPSPWLFSFLGFSGGFYLTR